MTSIFQAFGHAHKETLEPVTQYKLNDSTFNLRTLLVSGGARKSERESERERARERARGRERESERERARARERARERARARARESRRERASERERERERPGRDWVELEGEEAHPHRQHRQRLSSAFTLKALGFGVQGLVFRVQSLDFNI